MRFHSGSKRAAFCLVCGEYLGKYRENFARDHLVRFPAHKEFLVKTLSNEIGQDDSEPLTVRKMARD